MFDHFSTPPPHAGADKIVWTIYATRPEHGADGAVREICQRKKRGIVELCPDCRPPEGMRQLTTVELRQLIGEVHIDSCVFESRRVAVRIAYAAGLFLGGNPTV